jgi:tetratricopeptide (TPR) repeat protein
MKYIILILLFFSSFNSIAQSSSASKEVNEKQAAIVKECLLKCYSKYNYNNEMSQWQKCLDEGLAKDSTIAYLWQQKAMPLFKTRKYEAGMMFLDKAVYYDSQRWLDYRAFIKCIFAKTYKEAIIDFEKCKTVLGNSYVMDHTYDFHIALSYLQLNEFEKAEQIFKRDTEDQKSKFKEAHYLDLFYYAITLFEREKYEEANSVFDRSLVAYPNFADAKHYKAICLIYLNRAEESKLMFKESKEDLENGYTINEDQIHYETYPYQLKKR